MSFILKKFRKGYTNISQNETNIKEVNLSSSINIANSSYYKKIKLVFLLLLYFIIIIIFSLYKIENIYDSLIDLNKPPIEENLTFYKPIKKRKYTDYYRLKEIKKVSIIEKNKLPAILLKEKTNIHIAYAFDNYLIYQALVSMTSIVENINKTRTIVTFHILVSSNFKIKNKEILKTLLKHYPKNTEINFYNMSNVFEGIKKFKGGYATYYRLLLADIIPDLDKIIYLDTDTLALKDITDMYLINMENYYMMGFPDYNGHKVKYLGKKTKIYVCAGVLLLNLKKIRKDQKTKELIQFTITRNEFILYYDQDIINYIFMPYIGPLPSKYGVFNFPNFEDADKIYSTKLNSKKNKSELYEAIKNPSLVHYVRCEPKFYRHDSNFVINQESCKQDTDKFYYFANKTDFYNDIYKSLY